MKIEFRQEPIAQLATSALVTYAFEGSLPSDGSVERLPAESQRLLMELHSAGEFTGKAYECTLIHQPPGLVAAKLLVVGAGKKEKFNSAQQRRLAGTALRYLKTSEV